MRVSLSILLLLLAAGGATAWFRMHRQISPPSAPVRPAVLLISGDTAGWIMPCGCTANQSGGLLRRGTYVADLRKTVDVICADAGGAPAGVSPYHRVKFEAVLSGEIAMGIAAHNIGGPEAALGADYLRQTGARLKCPFISANAHDGAGRPLAEPLRIVDAAGRRVAIIGVLSPHFATADVRVDEPRQAILAALSAAKGKYDSVIVLAYLPEDELAALATELPEADAVVGGPTGQALAPKQVGPSLLAAATNKGKFLVQLDVPAAGSKDRFGGKVVEMGPAIADQDVQVSNLHDYLRVLAERDFPAGQTGLVEPLPADAPADYRIAGSESCGSCHASAMKSWAGSHHAHAWQTLQPRGFHVDAYCLQCHTTGYGLPGGFNSLRSTPALVGVGCENCHGPSAAHVKDPKVRTPFFAAARDQCIRCHDHENSPKFDYATYWPRILHGKESGGVR